MKIPERSKHEGLVEYAEGLSESYSVNSGADTRKPRGSFSLLKK